MCVSQKIFDLGTNITTVSERPIDYFVYFNMYTFIDLIQKVPTPFKCILTSVPVWSTIVTFFCDDIGYYVIFSTFPLYLREILKCDATYVSIHYYGFLRKWVHIHPFIFIESTYINRLSRA